MKFSSIVSGERRVKTALITGTTGRMEPTFRTSVRERLHGAWTKGRSSSFSIALTNFDEPQNTNSQFVLHYADMTDATNIIRVIQETQPDEIYNLAAQSHVQVSFDTPEYTANADAVGALRTLKLFVS